MDIRALGLPNKVVVVTPPHVDNCIRLDFGRVYATSEPVSHRGEYAVDGIVRYLVHAHPHIDVVLAGDSLAARAVPQQLYGKVNGRGEAREKMKIDSPPGLHERAGLERLAGKGLSEFLHPHDSAVEPMSSVYARVERCLTQANLHAAKTVCISAPEVCAFCLYEMLIGDLEESEVHQANQWAIMGGFSPASVTVLERDFESGLYTAKLCDAIVWQ